MGFAALILLSLSRSLAISLSSLMMTDLVPALTMFALFWYHELCFWYHELCSWYLALTMTLVPREVPMKIGGGVRWYYSWYQ
ncbi:hypothetical protein [Aeromonas veronii]|uniref:hypothetical protein n=1 Tax=Aeromonas veronii TaxID=654 RepID=UPI003AFF6CAE